MTYIARTGRSGASSAGRAMAGCGLGAVDLGTSLGAQLVRQVNRFTSRGLYGGRVFGAFEATLPVASSLATVAAIIAQARLLVAQAGLTAAGTKAQLAAVNAAMASGQTAAWVNTNLAAVIDAVRGYADAQGLPAWSPGGSSSALGGVSPVVVVVGLGVLYLVLKGRS